MKRLTFLMALLLLSLNTILSAQDYTPWYSDAYTRSDRKLNSVTLTSSAYGAQQATAGSNTYTDLTFSTTLRAQAGETLSVSFNYTGSWMNGYVYIDTASDGFTAGVNSSTHAPTGDLMSYSFYSGNDASDTSGYNSSGTYITGDSRSTLSMPSFTCPSTPGTYRMRFKVDWNSIDPAGDSNSTNDTFKGNGGAIVDVMLQVVGSVTTTYDVTFVYTLDGTEIARTTNNYAENADFPAYASIPSYVNVSVPTLPSTVTEEGTYTIATTTKDETPFKFSTSLENAQWTTMKLLFSKKDNGDGEAKTYDEGTWIAGSGVATILSYTDATETNYDQYIWAFVGDWYNGYKVYSYTDKNKKLVYTSNFTTSSDSYRTITLSDDATLADNQCTWIVVDWTGTDGVGYSEPTYSLRLNNSAHPNYYAGDHISSRVLGTWESTTGNQVNHGRIAFADPAPLYKPVAQQTLNNEADYGVGYPKSTSAGATALQEAIDNPSSTFDGLLAALNDFRAESDVVMPTDGKAYRIKAKYLTGDVRWLKFTENADATDEDLRLTLGLTDLNTEPTGYEGTFICHKVNDNEYIFTTNKGKFLTWCGDGKQNVTGKESSFASEYTYGTHNATLKLANTDIKLHPYASLLFGALTLQGWNNTNGDYHYLMAGETNFDYAGPTDMYYTNNRSSAFYFEETDYPNVVTLTQATGIDDGTKKIATFSAPFAFTVPEGVNAYVVETVPTSSTAQMAQLATAGSTVAANTGVILYGATAETQVRMIPATETGASNASSLLGQSAGEAKQIVDVTGQTNYILVNKDGNIVFSKALANGENKNISMNKAYLSIPAGSPVNQFALSFGEEGETTGINAIEAGQAGSTSAPVYDLSGRRISQPATRGIYIRGGKKFMVK